MEWWNWNAAKRPRFKIPPIKSGIGRLKRFSICNFQSFRFSIHSVRCLENSFRKACERSTSACFGLFCGLLANDNTLSARFIGRLISVKTHRWYLSFRFHLLFMVYFWILTDFFWIMTTMSILIQARKKKKNNTSVEFTPLTLISHDLLNVNYWLDYLDSGNFR